MVLDFIWSRRRYPDVAAAIQAGDLEAAISICRERLAQDTVGAATLHRKIAELSLMLGRRDEALREYQLAATVLEDAGRTLEAVAVYVRLLGLDPASPFVAGRLDELAAPVKEDDATTGPVTMSTHLRRRATLFSSLARVELSRLLPLTLTLELKTGATVFRQGEPGDTLFLIARGEVALTESKPWSPEVERERVRDGQVFGRVEPNETPTLDVNAMTIRPSLLLALTQESLQSAASFHPRIWNVVERLQGQPVASRV